MGHSSAPELKPEFQIIRFFKKKRCWLLTCFAGPESVGEARNTLGLYAAGMP